MAFPRTLAELPTHFAYLVPLGEHERTALPPAEPGV
jgi:hypothetical protein